jgi:hypothetical protein
MAQHPHNRFGGAIRWRISPVRDAGNRAGTNAPAQARKRGDDAPARTATEVNLGKNEEGARR